MNTKRKIIIYIIPTLTLLFVAFPLVSQGAPIVVCSGKFQQCNFGDIIPTINRIITWLIMIAVSVSAIMFAYAGFLYMTAAGDTGKMKKGKEIFQNVAIGFIIMLSAWLIIQLVLKSLQIDVDLVKKIFKIKN